jgi:mRNA interferase HigB
VRIIKEGFLAAAGRQHPPAARHLEVWRRLVKAATWRDLVEVRRTYPDTDALRVQSGRQVLVFNIRRNDYRLIVAAHFNRQIVYTLRFMTHAEYSKGRWKETL